MFTVYDALGANAFALAVETEVQDFLIVVLGARLLRRNALEGIAGHYFRFSGRWDAAAISAVVVLKITYIFVIFTSSFVIEFLSVLLDRRVAIPALVPRRFLIFASSCGNILVIRSNL